MDRVYKPSIYSKAKYHVTPFSAHCAYSLHPPPRLRLRTVRLSFRMVRLSFRTVRLSFMTVGWGALPLDLKKQLR